MQEIRKKLEILAEENDLTVVELLGYLLYLSTYHDVSRAISSVGEEIQEGTFTEQKKISEDHAVFLINADKGIGRETYRYKKVESTTEHFLMVTLFISFDCQQNCSQKTESIIMISIY